MKLSHLERQNQALKFLKWKNNSNSTHNESEIKEVKYTIPVVFHLIENTTSISDDQIAQLVSSLNRYFTAFNTQIEFCIAKTSPDGGVTSGITRINSSYNHVDKDLEDAKLKTHIQWDPRYYLNVWVVNYINGEAVADYEGKTWWSRTGIGGYATLPNGIISQYNLFDGIVISDLETILLAHECGHYLGLLHTWDGGCENGDCLVDGDMVCDTPPDNSRKNNCEENSCHTDTLSNYSNENIFEDVKDMTENLMDYSSCSYELTIGQIERMHFHIENYRADLYLQNRDDESCIAPCDANISITISQDNLFPMKGDSVKFTSSSIGVTNYAWYVDRLGDLSSYSVVLESGYSTVSSPVDSTSDLTYSFPDVGKYRVYLKAWNGDDSLCFTSYSKIVRVDCGVDARFFPNKKLIASKQPHALFTDSITFTNKSRGSSIYEWTVHHSNFDSTKQSLPTFHSDTANLNYYFTEPGNYRISLLANNGRSCYDSTLIFSLKVDDPTIDGIPAISKVECFNNDSIKVKLSVFNNGYDTINIGTPISFYDKNPLLTDENPKLLKIYELPEVVYGFESNDYTLFIDTDIRNLDNLYVLFNDTGHNNFPLVFPPNNQNVLSTNTIFPASGYAELEYSNNLNKFIIESKQSFSDVWACEGERLEYKIDENWISANWTSTLKGDLGITNMLSYVVTQEDTIIVVLNSSLGCSRIDEFLIKISRPIVYFDENEFVITSGESVQFNASGGIFYNWFPANTLNNDSIPNPLASPIKSTNYNVIMSDSIDCVTTDSINVIVIDKAFAPTLFTPNGDNRNDLFKIYGLENAQNFSLIIRNRKGNIVFQTSIKNEITQVGWDGNFSSKQQPNGIYYWQITGENDDGTQLKINNETTGIIHLIR